MRSFNDSPTDKHQQRFQAVLALFQGYSATQVEAQYHLCRSDLYKFKRRALTAMHAALVLRKRGPRRPANRLGAEQEQQIKTVCERHPTWSFYHVRQHLSSPAPTPRTIQRV